MPNKGSEVVVASQAIPFQAIPGRAAKAAGGRRMRWDRLRRFRLELLALFLACFTRGTPWSARLAAVLTFAYILSPIDLVPDTIPILGQLDDLTLIALAFMNIPRLIPAEVMHGANLRASEQLTRLGSWWTPIKRTLTAAILVVPVLTAVVVGVVATLLMR